MPCVHTEDPDTFHTQHLNNSPHVSVAKEEQDQTRSSRPSRCLAGPVRVTPSRGTQFSRDTFPCLCPPLPKRQTLPHTEGLPLKEGVFL